MSTHLSSSQRYVDPPKGGPLTAKRRNVTSRRAPRAKSASHWHHRPSVPELPSGSEASRAPTCRRAPISEALPLHPRRGHRVSRPHDEACRDCQTEVPRVLALTIERMTTTELAQRFKAGFDVLHRQFALLEGAATDVLGLLRAVAGQLRFLGTSRSSFHATETKSYSTTLNPSR